VLIYKTGDLFSSSATCIVNTVNLEGFMGKGIAYEFKRRFPHNYKDYQLACKSKQIDIGKLHYFVEDNRMIVNFPTKNKWREKSRIEYIEKGLLDLVKIIKENNIVSIAIPPLGCGNGGLNWLDVKKIIDEHLRNLENVSIEVYEPSNNIKSQKISNYIPKMNASHLLLMMFKPKLKKFSKLRVQKTAFMLNVFSGTEYFVFDKYHYGPYAHSIDILIKDIKDYQDHFNYTTQEALSELKRTLLSETVESKISLYSPFVDQSTQFINSCLNDDDLELKTTILYCITKKPLAEVEIISEIKHWSTRKAQLFSAERINNTILGLTEQGLITKDLMDKYTITS